jgi:crotonobetainyl-CoA:carnitine CoA-transferase CaiB-like acyl-CoA transferase
MARPGPLTGLRVLEAATYLTGPLAARTLGELGADVVKVEAPGGDPYRRFGRRVGGVGVMWAQANHGKELVTLDLKQPAGRADLLRRLSDTDVLITNWRPGVAAGLGLVDEEIRRTCPALIWCRINGFGPDGPAAGAPAFDAVIQARSGLMHAQGAPGPPVAVRSLLADKLTGTMAVQAVLAALHQRDVTGDGAVVELAMLDAMAWFNSFDVLTEHAVVDRPGAEVNPQLASVRPSPTSDGWILLSPVRARQLDDAAQALGHPEWTAQLKAIADPAELTEHFFHLVATVTPTGTTAHWLGLLAAHDVPAGEVLDLPGHLTDPQVVHNAVYRTVDHPQLGRMRAARYPARWIPGG